MTKILEYNEYLNTMTYVIDRYKIICKNDAGEQILHDAFDYSETVDFLYVTSATKNTSVSRGWRGDVMVDYILMNTQDHNKTTSTEYRWDDVILIKVEPTKDMDWKYTFAKK